MWNKSLRCLEGIPRSMFWRAFRCQAMKPNPDWTLWEAKRSLSLAWEKCRARYKCDFEEFIACVSATCSVHSQGSSVNCVF